MSELPTGREHGRFLALDLGGTNFRSANQRQEGGARECKRLGPISGKLFWGKREGVNLRSANRILEVGANFRSAS